MRRQIDISLAEDVPISLYLTDSTETNRVRTPIDVGTMVEVRCAVVSRALTLNERAEWRNIGVLPGEIGVDPQIVECSVIAPGGFESSPAVQRTATGIFVATIEVARAGGWFYRFSGRGGYVASEQRAFDVKAVR